MGSRLWVVVLALFVGGCKTSTIIEWTDEEGARITAEKRAVVDNFRSNLADQSFSLDDASHTSHSLAGLIPVTHAPSITQKPVSSVFTHWFWSLQMSVVQTSPSSHSALSAQAH